MSHPIDKPSSVFEGSAAPCDSLALDLETEQLITEIEQLTNRALQETCQWTTSSTAATPATSLTLALTVGATSSPLLDLNEIRNRNNNVSNEHWNHVATG